MIKISGPRFELGQIVSTPGAIGLLAEHRVLPSAFLHRHVTGDFGDICEEDSQLNEQAIDCGERVMSSYTLAANEKLWIITEADRSVTTLLLPEEY